MSDPYPSPQAAPRTVRILFLGGAKRVSIGRKIIEAGAALGLAIEIFSYELEAEVPAALLGGVVIGRRWSAPDILEHLHQVVHAYGIDILLPFVDGAISVAGRYVAEYGDAWAPVTLPVHAEAFFDKCASARLFEEAGLPIPATFKGGRPVLPLIAKPRHGSASKGIEIIDTPAAFKAITANSGEYLLQRYYADREEYTVDCYVAMHGRSKVLCVSPRRRLETVGGEASRTVTVDYPELTAAALTALERLPLRGAVTLQYLRDLDSGSLMLMEINPRLGGGVVCSVHAGADIPRIMLRDWLGLPPEAAARPEPGTLVCRYMDEAVFRGYRPDSPAAPK